MKRLLGYLLIVTMLVMSFTACSSTKSTPTASDSEQASATPSASSGDSQSSETADNTDVTGEVLFYHHWTDLNTTVFPEYVKEFNEIYPNVKITLEAVGKDYASTLKIKLAANDVPDVFEPDSNFMDVMSQKCLPLNDLEITEDYIGADKFTGADGNIYGLPEGLNTYGVIYNKKIFSELGIAVPTTLDEFIAAAKTINDSGKEYVGLASAAKAKWPLQYYWQSVPIQLSGDPDVLNKLADVDHPFTADNAVVQSYVILKSFTENMIFEADPLSADWEPMKTEFRSGTVGMFFLGNWFIPQAIGDVLTADDIGFFPFPYDNNGGKNVVVEADNSWAISKTSKSPEAAKAWLLFLADKKCAEFAKLNGFMSPRKSIVVDLPCFQEFDSFNPIKIVSSPQSGELQTITSQIQFDYSAVAQNVVAGNDINKEFDDLNSKWKKAKASQ